MIYDNRNNFGQTSAVEIGDELHDELENVARCHRSDIVAYEVFKRREMGSDSAAQTFNAHNAAASSPGLPPVNGASSGYIRPFRLCISPNLCGTKWKKYIISAAHQRL